MLIYRRPESVLVIVYALPDRVLVLRRRHPPGYWQSVTGALEWGETPLQAARRELYEETGLSGRPVEDCHRSRLFAIYPIFRHRYAPGVCCNLEHVFRCRLARPEWIQIDPQEHEEFRWVGKAQALRLVVSYTNREAIEQCVPQVSGQGGA